MENSILSSHPPSVTSRLDCPAPQSRNHTHEIPERVISNAFSGCMENLWSQHPGICILARILKCLCLLKSENYKSWIFHFNGVSPFIRIHYKGGGSTFPFTFSPQTCQPITTWQPQSRAEQAAVPELAGAPATCPALCQPHRGGRDHSERPEATRGMVTWLRSQSHRWGTRRFKSQSIRQNTLESLPPGQTLSPQVETDKRSLSC